MNTPPIAPDNLTLHLSIKPTPIGKPIPAGKDGSLSAAQRREITESWQAVAIPPADLIDWNTSGKPLAVAQFQDGYRLTANFQRSNLIALDFDGGVKEHALDGKAVKYMNDTEYQQLIALPFIQDAAFAVIQSASSKAGRYKARVLIALDAIITDAGEYSEFYRWVVSQLPGADHTTDAARFFYGGQPGRAADFIRLENVLAVAPIRAAIAAEKAAENERREKFIREWESSDDPYTEAKEALSFIPAQPEYSEWIAILAAIHDSFPGAEGIALAEAWSPDKPGVIERKFASFKNGYTGAKATIASVFYKAMQHGYEPRSAQQKLDKILRDSALSKRYNDMQNRVEFVPKNAENAIPYISDLVINSGACYLIKSGMGTGKTELAKRQIAALPSGAKVLYVAHRQLLVTNAAARLELENYQDHIGFDLGQYDRLAVCLPSLLKFQTLPTCDLLIIDEIEQVLAALFDATLKNHEPVNVHEKLLYLIAHAKTVLCLDAHASKVALMWLQNIRPDVQFIENTYEPDEKTPLTLWKDHTAMLAYCDQLLATDGDPILIACGKGLSNTLYERYSKKLSAGAVRVINSDNSQSDDTQQFVININTELPKIKLLIGSPSMGSGIDIITPVRAVFGVFRQQPQTAPEMLQMLGRARVVGELHVTMPLEERTTSLETNRNVIALDERRRALESGKLVVSILPDGNLSPIVTDEQQRLSNLEADIIAHRNQSFNYLIKDFAHLARPRYALKSNEASANKAIKAQLKAAKESFEQQRQAQVLTAPVIPLDEYERCAAKGDFDPAVIRYEIETFYKQPITPVLYEFDNTGAGRGLMLAFGDLLSNAKHVARRDLEAIDNGAALHNRAHYAKLRRLRRALIQAVWGGEKDNIQALVHRLHKNSVTLEQIEAGVKAFLGEHHKDVTLFSRRNCLSDDPLDFVRWVLKKVGLELELIRNCAEAGKYRVSKDSLNQMIGLYNARQAALQPMQPELPARAA